MEKKKLSMLSVGECGVVTALLTEGSMRRRFLDIGICGGTLIRCVGKSPFGDPLLFSVRGTDIAIRRRDAEGIIIK